MFRKSSTPPWRELAKLPQVGTLLSSLTCLKLRREGQPFKSALRIIRLVAIAAKAADAAVTAKPAAIKVWAVAKAQAKVTVKRGIRILRRTTRPELAR